jgi:hypothetical protein
MNPIKIIALLLIIGGALGLAYGGFTYSRKSTVAEIGPIEINANTHHTVNVPVWVGIGGIAVGALLLALGNKRP